MRRPMSTAKTTMHPAASYQRDRPLTPKPRLDNPINRAGLRQAQAPHAKGRGTDRRGHMATYRNAPRKLSTRRVRQLSRQCWICFNLSETRSNARSRLIPPDQENPLGPCTSSASFRSGPEPREWHYGQRHIKGRTYRSDTWPHQPATAKTQIGPCQRRAVHTRPIAAFRELAANDRYGRFHAVPGARMLLSVQKR